jgi:hypothetical protein
MNVETMHDDAMPANPQSATEKVEASEVMGRLQSPTRSAVSVEYLVARVLMKGSWRGFSNEC